MMRLVIGKLLSLIERYPPLVDGAFIIIFWVGSRLLLDFFARVGLVNVEIPNWFSLTLIVVIFGAAFLYARSHERRKTRAVTIEDKAKKLFD